MPLVHDSWMRLKPNEIDGRIEPFEVYYSRVLEKVDFNHIPKEVFAQWIHPHHNNHHTLTNYAWVDFTKVRFELCEWETEQFLDLNVIDDFKEWVESRSHVSDFSKFQCISAVLETWQYKGTWVTPPVIVDVRSLNEPPPWSELKLEFQLVEGHTRLGYLKSMIQLSREGKAKLSSRHKIYLMRSEQSANNPFG